MDGRKALEINDPARIPVLPRLTDGQGQQAGGGEWVLPARWAWFAALVGPVVAVLCMSVEPPPSDPDAAEPVLGMLLFLALMISWAGAAVRAVQRRRGALAWASVVGLLSVAMTVGCPASGHHAGVGTWWFGQLAVSGVASAVAVGACRRIGRPSPATSLPAGADRDVAD